MDPNDEINQRVQQAVMDSLVDLGMDPKSPTFSSAQLTGANYAAHSNNPAMSNDPNVIAPRNFVSAVNGGFTTQREFSTPGASPWPHPSWTPDAPQTAAFPNHGAGPSSWEGPDFRLNNDHMICPYNTSVPRHASQAQISQHMLQNPHSNSYDTRTPVPCNYGPVQTPQYGIDPFLDQQIAYGGQLSNQYCINGFGQPNGPQNIVPPACQNVNAPQAYHPQWYQQHQIQREDVSFVRPTSMAYSGQNVVVSPVSPILNNAAQMSTRNQMRIHVEGDEHSQGPLSRCPIHNEVAGYYGKNPYWRCGCRRGLMMNKFTL